jgi:hypothetical protein
MDVGNRRRSLIVAAALAGVTLLGAAGLSDGAAQISCDPSYPDFCIAPAWDVGDLNCADVVGAWFSVYQPDGHGFDADADGFGCES